MFETDSRPRLFALPPGADFAHQLVAGLVTRSAGLPPEAMARMTVYLNTGRMLRRVQSLFDDHGARLLPRLRLVTDIGLGPVANLPPAVSPLRRRLELEQLVRRLLEKTPDFAPVHASADLADSLARLMAEMHDEGVDPGDLTPALAEDHAAHWERSLRFIRLVSRFFDAGADPDAESRQRHAVTDLTQRWIMRPPAHPVILAGSTGSRGTTQMLMRAVGGLPQGAVVLPGFDFDMPENAWNSLDSGAIPQEDHPQFRFLSMIRALGAAPGDVRRWTDAPPPDAARNRLISLSLRPAPVTDRWRAEGAALGDLRAATARLSLIEAPTPRSEALAIALILREAVEHGRRAALITPDRMLTRRVTAALDRWRLIPDDSAGRPLALTAPGRLLRHVARMTGQPLTGHDLLTLLKHPLTASGGNRGRHLLLTRELELSLRRWGPVFPSADEIRAWADRHNPADLGWAAWLGRVIDGLPQPEMPLSAWIETHLGLVELVAAGPDGSAATSELWQKAAGAEALRAMESLRREADAGAVMTPARYADLLDNLLQAGSVRDIDGADPRVTIRGTLEARVTDAELVVVAGLNDGIWPAVPEPDPWLSRQMRLRAGLLLPERKIGLAAHDFQQAVGAPQVILSRPLRDAEAETVASRWIARLTNLMQGLPDQHGPEALEAMRGRGAQWLQLVTRLEWPGTVAPARRPAPRPPVAHRPDQLPVTDISTLIRDPYAIYAKRILRLRPLDPLRASPDARLRGSALHAVAEAFLRAPDRAVMTRDRLLALSEQVLADRVPWPSARRFWLARMARIADAFLVSEARRAERGDPVVIEGAGQAKLLGDTFALIARADRIDWLTDGRAHVFDYKSGAPPSSKQQEHFEKQLILESAMVEKGGFAGLGCVEVEAYSYIQLGGEGETRTVSLLPGDTDEAWAQLEDLITRYREPARGYVARRAVFRDRLAGDYDHLARYGEWATSDAPEPEDMA